MPTRAPLLAILLVVACRGGDEPPAPVQVVSEVDASAPIDDRLSAVRGPWRAVLQSPGGELAFELALEGDDERIEAMAFNGEERIRFDRASFDGKKLRLEITGYDSLIEAQLEGEGKLAGTWSKRAPDKRSELPFTATRGEQPRYPHGREAASFGGRWNITFSEEDGSSYVGLGIFEQVGSKLSGTILTDTGDYRWLAGAVDADLARLSVFDGAHAFLFSFEHKGDSLEGDFWSRDSYHASFTATRALASESPLADGWAEVSATDPKGRFRFALENLDGALVKDSDFAGQVLLVDVFGTWCPNCNDQAKLLAKWDRRYRDGGLAIVGLAFEHTGDVEADREMLRRYRSRHAIEFPLLLAGTSDKAEAAKVLPDLSEVKSYPTAIFVARDGKVRKIYSGFAGPATGVHHETLVRESETLIESLLAEPAPGAPAPTPQACAARRHLYPHLVR